METLTQAEERIMQIIWDKGRGIVRDFMAGMEEPVPPYSTVSSVVRILEKKGFVGHKAYGRTHEYFPLISKAEYRQQSFRRMMGDYFGGSPENIVAYLVQEENLSKDEIEGLLNAIDQDEQK